MLRKRCLLPFLNWFCFRYHEKYYRDFVNKRLIKSLHNQYNDSSPDKDALSFIIQSILNEPKKYRIPLSNTWFTLAFYEKY